MIARISKTTMVFVFAFLLIAVWGFIAYDSTAVNQRTTTETSSISANPPTQDESPKETSPQNTTTPPPGPADPLTPPATKLPEVPAPEQRVPGTPLNEKTLKDLGVDEPLIQEEVFYATATPNDTIYPQWYTTIIDAPDAWDVSTGSSSTLIAVIDTGFGLDHEDLTDSWFINIGEQGVTASGDLCWSGSPEDKQTNGCDDDSNGFADDWRGWDFANGDNNPQAGDNSASGANHGTKTAGLVGARGNNGIGVASVNWGTQILPLQSLVDEGYGYSSDIAGAIYYAVDMGADVINMSLGGSSPDTYTLAAVQFALRNNVIVVASSGNCGANQTDPECATYPSPGGMGYPGRYAETIAVGATTSTDTRASFSSWGDELDIVAPGSGTIRTPTWSTSNGTSAYSSTSYGTSFSAPIVAGAVGVIKGEFPNITKDEVMALLQNSVDKVAGMGSDDWTAEYGYGRLNFNNLLVELAEYRQQLNKAGGMQIPLSSNVSPQVSSNTGHGSANAITNSTDVRTYCLAKPLTLCSLEFKKNNSSPVVTFPALLTNNQGIAVFEWGRSDVGSGLWYLRSVSDSKKSSPEKLTIQ